MRNLATTERRNVEDLYESFGWELGDEYGHILDAFKREFSFLLAECDTSLLRLSINALSFLQSVMGPRCVRAEVLFPFC